MSFLCKLFLKNLLTLKLKSAKMNAYKMKCIHFSTFQFNYGGDILPEKTIAIRVDEELFKKVKQRVFDKDTTLKQYLIDLIQQDIEQKQNLNKVELNKEINILKEVIKSLEQK